MASGSKSWSVFSLASALLGAAVAKKFLNTSWRAATGKNPPGNPADPDVDLREAILWAAASGAVIQLVRMAFARGAAGYYVKSTGHLPPELQKDGQHADAADAPTT